MRLFVTCDKMCIASYCSYKSHFDRAFHIANISIFHTMLQALTPPMEWCIEFCSIDVAKMHRQVIFQMPYIQLLQ